MYEKKEAAIILFKYFCTLTHRGTCINHIKNKTKQSENCNSKQNLKRLKTQRINRQQRRRLRRERRTWKPVSNKNVYWSTAK